MKFCPVVPEICRGQVHGPRKERKRIIIITRGSQEPVSFTWLSKKNNWSYVKAMSCSGSHLGITINIKNTKFVKDLPMIDA